MVVMPADNVGKTLRRTHAEIMAQGMADYYRLICVILDMVFQAGNIHAIRI